VSAPFVSNLTLQKFRPAEGRIRDVLNGMDMKLPRFKNMSWRLDAQVCAPTLHRCGVVKGSGCCVGAVPPSTLPLLRCASR
jgi:hypothetical protein